MSSRLTLRNNSAKEQPDSASESPMPDTPQTARASSGFDFTINPLEMMRLLFQKRRLIICGTLAVMILSAAYLLMKPNLYTSRAIILPSGKSGGISALGSLIDMGRPLLSSDENSSALFPVILRSDLVVDAVAEKNYSFNHNGREMTVNLKDLLGIVNPDKLRNAILSMTSIRADQQTGEIYIGFESRYPGLSRAVLQEYLDQLEDYNLHKRRSAAAENAAYLGRQVADAKAQLQEAEDALEAFQKTNSDWAISTSPEILKEAGRLEREVQIKSGTYLMLVQNHETAQLEARKDVPIIRILDSPSLPTIKSGPYRRNMILGTGFVACFLLCFVIIARDLVRQTATGAHRDDYRALSDDLRQSFSGAMRAVNRIHRRITSKPTLKP